MPMGVQQIAAISLMVISIVVALFQFALALGAPWGQWAFGGQNPGRLPTRLRVTSALSLVVYIAQFWFFGIQAHVLTDFLSPVFSAWVSWTFVGLFALGTLMNAVSRSIRERALWTPIVALSLICAVMVAL